MVGLVAIGLGLHRVFHRPDERLDRRRRLGVPTQGRLATAKDLRALLIRHPEADRLVLGRFGRWLVATEASPSARVSARGAVALVGPTRSGKTTTLTGAILDWEGPAVLVSVKTDLLVDTHVARARRGPTHVFDPAGVTGRGNACWSPLAEATTTSGAIKAAAGLVEAAPRTGRVEGSEFWMQMAESLMAALLAVAANADQAFSEVVGWVVSLDMPSEASPGKVAPLYRALREDADPLRRAAGVFAADVLEGLWRNDHRTISSVYATARTLVWPWADPIVAASAKDKPIDPGRHRRAAGHRLAVGVPDRRRLWPRRPGHPHQPPHQALLPRHE
ncbi:MAG: type IV secretory system conjugative DNA transfer family protein [Acidimicrobiales bacterium]